MRHQVAGKKLNRDTNHRRSLFKTQIKQLLANGHLTTTIAKAKLLKVHTEKLLNQAKDKSVPSLRRLEAELSSKKAAQAAVTLATRLNTDQGFIKTTRLEKRRGDNVMMVKVELMLKPEEVKETKTVAKPKKTVKTKNK